MRVCASCARLLATGACPDDGGDAVKVEELPARSRVGPYEIVDRIGKGGMGHVYEAVHRELERRVAIKVLRDDVADDELVERFLREARAVSLIDHDNVISVYDYGDGSAGAVYFVMEMLDGETLWDLGRRRGRLDPALCHHIYDQIMAALEAAHRRDVIHRDLKPTNVFIVERESNRHFVKLLDFGIARLLGDRQAPRLTVEGTVMGTPEYMSPEQIAGKPADARADIYALGVMLYESLTGQVPFPAAGSSFPALARRVLDEPPVPPSRLAPISSALEQVILAALAKSPGDRFESIAAMRAAFDAAFDDPDEVDELDTARTLPSGSGLEPVTADPPASPARRSPWLLAAAAALLAGAIAASVAIATSLGEPGPGAVADAAPPTVASLWVAGDRQEAAALARASLEADLGSADPVRREAVGRGVVAAATGAAAALLYRALEGGPTSRREAAARIAELRLYEGAAPIRAVLDRSGETLRVTLAAELFRLGDRSGLALLEAGLESGDPRIALVAAEALATRDDNAEPALRALEAIAADTPAGRDSWRLANAALHRAGDERAGERLAAELTQSPERAVAAAALLAADDESAADYLERVVADDGFTARAAAARALARLGRSAALGFVEAGLASGDELERLAALEVAARLGKRGGERYAVQVAALAGASSPRVSAAARTALLAF